MTSSSEIAGESAPTMIKDLQAQGLTRTVLALLFMALLTAASFWVLHLFLGAMVWAAMIVVSTWPLMLGVQARLRGSRTLATAVMTLSLVLLVVLPFLSAVAALVSHSEEIVGGIQSLTTFSVPPPPGWVGDAPRHRQEGRRAVAAGHRHRPGGGLRVPDPLCRQGARLVHGRVRERRQDDRPVFPDGVHRGHLLPAR